MAKNHSSNGLQSNWLGDHITKDELKALLRNDVQQLYQTLPAVKEGTPGELVHMTLNELQMLTHQLQITRRVNNVNTSTLVPELMAIRDDVCRLKTELSPHDADHDVLIKLKDQACDAAYSGRLWSHLKTCLAGYKSCMAPCEY